MIFTSLCKFRMCRFSRIPEQVHNNVIHALRRGRRSCPGAV